ncbi:hypothetical protein, partial [Escherichia coli]|uniref:hypothetical protein n=1 Tax=Escherichia coli TaxID=562 RepID=UPI002022F54F
NRRSDKTPRRRIRQCADVDAGCGASTLSGLQTGAKHANHHHRPTQAQLVLASELGRCYRRAGRLVAGRGNGTAYAD